MSKLDAQRAMREARYNAQKKSAPAPAARPAVAPPAAAEPAASDGLCGHRSMNGRTCTRELGHAAASHRYS